MPNLTFEIIDKDTPDYLDHIDKRELEMLIQMMEELQHGSAEATRKAYGYKDGGEWDEAQLAKYKNETLAARMRDKNYTFFLLKNEAGKTIALASGDAPYQGEHLTDKKERQLRLMNITVAKEYKGNDYVSELMKRLSHYAYEQDFDRIVVPLSPHARAHGKVDMYEHIMQESRLDLPHAMRPHANARSASEGHVEMDITPKRFMSLEPTMTTRYPWDNPR